MSSYIRKTGDIFTSPEIQEVLFQMKDQSEVARLFLKQRHPIEDLVVDHVNYISISKSDRTKISYLSHDRLDKVDGDFWSSPKRFNIKPGAFVRKVFTNISEKEIEKFATLFKNIQTAPDFSFKVVEGDEILKYYLYNSYSDQSSSLGASCMKHRACQDFLGIYVDNSDTVKMLVMLDRGGKLIGRALLWNTDIKIMDRIYTIGDDDFTTHFKRWADDNGYMYKREQRWNNTLFFQSKESISKLELSVTLKNKDYRKYPYLDTFKFFNQETGTFYNYIPEGVEVVTLSATDGEKGPRNLFALDGKTSLFHNWNDTVWIDYNGYRTHLDNTRYSSINKKRIMKEDAIYNKELEDYIFIDDTKNDKEAISKKLGPIKEKSKDWHFDIDIQSMYPNMCSDALPQSPTETINQWVNQWRDIHNSEMQAHQPTGQTLYQDPA